MDLNNSSPDVLVVRFDGKDHELQPGVNPDVPDTLASFALRQHPEHVTRVRSATASPANESNAATASVATESGATPDVAAEDTETDVVDEDDPDETDEADTTKPAGTRKRARPKRK